MKSTNDFHYPKGPFPSRNTSKNKTLNATFHLFNKLPYDIRFLIWREALNPGNKRHLFSLLITLPAGKDFHQSRISFAGPTPPKLLPRSIVASCKEARDIARTLFPDTMALYPCRTETYDLYEFMLANYWPTTSEITTFRFNAARDFFDIHFDISSALPSNQSNPQPALALILSAVQNLVVDQTGAGVNDQVEIGRYLPCFPSLRQISVMLALSEPTPWGLVRLPTMLPGVSSVQNRVTSSWRRRRLLYEKECENENLVAVGDETLSRLSYTFCTTEWEDNPRQGVTYGLCDVLGDRGDI